jgi:hypothetical protein
MYVLHENPFNNKVTCLCVNFEQFGEVEKLQYRGRRKFFFSSPQMPYVELLFPFERKLIFQEVQKWFFHLQ